MLHGSAQATGSALVPGTAIREHTRIGYDEMAMLLEKMVEVGWVGRVQDELPARARWGSGAREGVDNWVLLAEPGGIRLADVYRLFVFDAAGADGVTRNEPVLVVPDTALSLDTAALARQVETAVEQGLDETLAAHFGQAA